MNHIKSARTLNTIATIINSLVCSYVAFFAALVSIGLFFGSSFRVLWYGHTSRETDLAAVNGGLLLLSAIVLFLFLVTFIVLGILYFSKCSKAISSNDKSRFYKGGLAIQISSIVIAAIVMVAAPLLGFFFDHIGMNDTFGEVFGGTVGIVLMVIVMISLILVIISSVLFKKGCKEITCE